MPSSSSGQNVDAATASTIGTTTAKSSRGTVSASTNGGASASTAAQRRFRNPLGSTSVTSTPARLSTSPAVVDRKAAPAPAAIRPPSSQLIQLDPSAPAGTSSTAASDCPLTSSCGVYSRDSAPSRVTSTRKPPTKASATIAVRRAVRPSELE